MFGHWKFTFKFTVGCSVVTKKCTNLLTIFLLTYVAILLITNNYVLSDVLQREAKHNIDVFNKLEAIENKVDELDNPDAVEVSKNALNAANNILVGYKQQDVLGVILGNEVFVILISCLT